MPKADHALSTSIPAPQSRREVILGAASLAAGVVAGGECEALAIASPTPELLEYRRRKAIWNANFVEPYDETPEWHLRVEETANAVEDAIKTFVVRSYAPHSWADIHEIAELVRTELWDISPNVELAHHGYNDEVDALLLRAVLVMGGVNV